jgi:glycosyltransferase involved in cell wall biosynthesis
MALGLAVIATDVGAVGRLVSERTGWLIPPQDGRALVSALREAVTIPYGALISKQESASALIHEDYLWSKVILQLLDQIRSVIEKAEEPCPVRS